jgi:NAD(P)-dependent dehydrogenase (short-subunit alcohol dehydrogenase family)
MTTALAGKIACVTGAAAGIGFATAAALARAGALVVATDIAPGGDVLAAPAAAGGQGVYMRQDVTDEGQWQAVIARIAAGHGRLDVLVNNAGIGLSGPVTAMSLGEWRRQVAVNLDGVFLGVKHTLPLMRAGGGGSIVNMSSIAGSPEDIAAGVLWLAGDESRYVTGTELVIDGGRSIA